MTFDVKTKAWRRLMKNILKRGRRLDTLLDIPCGRAEIFTFARKRCKHYYGVDPDPAKLRRAKFRHPTSQFRLGDLTRIPYPMGMFDVVFSWAGFTSTEPDDLEKALKEVLRVSRRYIVLNFNALLKEDDKAPDDSIPPHLVADGTTYLRGKHIAEIITRLDPRFELVGMWQYGKVEQVGELKYACYVNLYELGGRPIGAPKLARPGN